MKFTITGSLGNVSKPLTRLLVGAGHTVTVVSSDPAKKPLIEALGAVAAIGSIGDVAFLTSAFAGADAVYCMIPMSLTEGDASGYMQRMAAGYVSAVRAAGVRRVVVLSGWAADLLSEGNAEEAFDGLSGVAVSVLRPASFYTNFYMSMELIRGKGWMGRLLGLRYYGIRGLFGRTGLLMGNYGGDDRTVFVSPVDIAEAAAEELVGGVGLAVGGALASEAGGVAAGALAVGDAVAAKAAATGGQSVAAGSIKKIRYVGSEEMTCNEAARIIGTAIGKPWLKWVRISDKAMLRGLKMAKMPDKLAASLVEMQALMHKGLPLAAFHRSKPRMGKVKLAAFAAEFAAVYRASSSQKA